MRAVSCAYVAHSGEIGAMVQMSFLPKMKQLLSCA
jgi:hypothetical protein